MAIRAKQKQVFSSEVAAVNHSDHVMHFNAPRSAAFLAPFTPLSDQAVPHSFLFRRSALRTRLDPALFSCIPVAIT